MKLLKFMNDWATYEAFKDLQSFVSVSEMDTWNLTNTLFPKQHVPMELVCVLFKYWHFKSNLFQGWLESQGLNFNMSTEVVKKLYWSSSEKLEEEHLNTTMLK